MSYKTLSAVIIVVALGLGLYWFWGAERKEASVSPAPRADSDTALAAFLRSNPPKLIPAFSFADGAGVASDLSKFKGRVILLNLWATWCAPCRKEMPELAKLQKDLGSADFEVVALSQDLKGAEASAAFLKQAGADNLALYVDPKATALSALAAPGLPLTLLINRKGEEVGRLIGPAAWDSKAAQQLIKAEIDAK